MSNIYFCALGGLGEIGLNSSFYRYDSIDKGDIIVVDLGIKFASQDFPGFEIIIPNIDWLMKNKKKIKGIFLTHAHEDHIGALPYLWDKIEEIGCKVYGSKFTIETVKEKITRINGDISQLQVVDFDEQISISDSFNVTFINVTHSVPQAALLLIETPSGRLIHTGDWKIDDNPVIGRPFNHERLKEIGEKGVLAIFSDSTNVFSKGSSGSELQVKESMLSNLKQCKGKIIITCFASNVVRIQIAVELAKSLNRKLMVIGHSFKKFIQVAKTCGLLPEIDNVLVDRIKGKKSDEVIILCSGSQGELNGSLLRLSENNISDVQLEQDDVVVFSSRVIPGNDKRIAAVQNSFAQQGIDIIVDDDFCTHVSGHPCSEELRRMYQYIKPKMIVPIHGESSHLLRHARLAAQEGVNSQFVLNNGDILEINESNSRIVSQIDATSLIKYGQDFISIKSPILRERARLSHNGVLHITLCFGENGKLDLEPIISSYGLTEDQDSLEEEVLSVLDDYFTNNNDIKSISDNKIKKILNSHFRGTLGIMPVVIITVIG